ncbi:tandem-95 repeat protein [Marinomonas sp. 2405UD66-6]|uniref:tandem-95 repeat protein n=1 Tax=Marinomonas sp. 2405UD66-6 TaxID=3391834 RepID=UPI0039C93A34
MSITDNESAPVVTTVSQNVIASEGDDLEFDVILSTIAAEPQTFAFSLTDGTTDSSDYGDVTFSDGVTYDAETGQITVPAGVAGFTVTVAGAEDTVLESDETFTLSVGGVESIGTISNDDDNPVDATNDSLSLDEDNSITLNLLDNDSGLDGGLEVTEIAGIELTGEAQSIAVNNGNVEINADGVMTFVPTTDYSGTVSFDYSVKDINGSVDTATVTVTVDAVADAPSLTVTETVTIDVDSLDTSGNSGYTITGYSNFDGLNSENNVVGELTSITGTDHDGIGVNAETTNGSDTISEIGADADQSEALVVTFDNAVTSIDVSLGWLSNVETATYTLYADGQEVSTNTFSSGNNNVNDIGSISFTDDNGNPVAFDTIVFSAEYDPDATGSSDNDYLLNSLTFENVVTDTSSSLETVEGGDVSFSINAASTDVDGSETLTVEVQDIPVGFTLTDGTNTFTATDGLTVADVSDWSLSSLTLETAYIDETTTYDLNVVATASEGDSTSTSTQVISIDVVNDGAIATPEINFENPGDDGVYSDEEVGDHGTVTATISVQGSEIGDKLTYQIGDNEEITVTLTEDDLINGINVEVEPGDKLIATLSDEFGNSSSSTDTAPERNNAPVAVDDSIISYDTGIRLDEAPEYGVMEVQDENGEWVEMTVGVTYDPDTEVRFVSDADAIDEAVEFSVGSFDEDPDTTEFDGTAAVSDWGDVSDDDKSVVKSFDTDSGGNITITTSVTSETDSTASLIARNGDDVVGNGIGSSSSGGLRAGESLIVDIDTDDVAINKVSFTLSGLGGAFDEDSGAATEVHITAYFADGTSEVMSGYREGDNAYEATYTFITDTGKAVESFELTTSGGNGKYVVQNMTVSQVISDEVTLTTLQGDGSESTTSLIFDPSETVDGVISMTDEFIDVDGDLTGGAIATDEDTAITIDVLANDYDIDDDSLSITNATVVDESQGTVEIADGKLVFTPADDFSGEVTINYIISDGELFSEEAHVTLIVDAVADAPTLDVELSEAVFQGGVTLNGDNVDDLGSSGDNIINSAGVLTDSVSREFDFGDEYAGQEVTISFDSVITGGWEDGERNNRRSYEEIADTYTISINGVQQGQFIYEQNTGTQTHNQTNSYTVTLDDEGKATVQFDVASTANIEVVNITNIQASVDSLDSISQLNIVGAQTDIDGSEVLSYTISELPDGAELLDANGEVIDASSDGNYSLTADEVAGLQVKVGAATDDFDIEVTVTSTDGDSTAQTSQTIRIGDTDTDTDTSENTAPVAVGDSVSTLDSGFAGLVGSYYGTDTQINSLSEFLSIAENNDPTATFNATNIDYSSSDSITQETSVATGTNLQAFLGDDAASLSSDPGDNTDGGIHLQGYIYLAAGTYNFQVNADDGYQVLIDGNDVASISSIQSETLTTHDEFTISEDGYYAIDMVWWDQGGDYVFQPMISSDGGSTYSTLDSSMLSSINGTPLASADEQSIIISADTLLANDTDTDGDDLSITEVSNFQNGIATLVDGNVVFIPTEGFSGTASFDYIITDGNGGYDTATASIEVTSEASDIQPTVTVTVSEGVESTTSSESESWDGFSSNDADYYDADDYTEWVGFTDDDEKVYIADDVIQSLQTKGGDDQVVVGDDIYSAGGVLLGAGDDKLLVGDRVEGSIDAGAGNDEVYVGNDVSAYIGLGDGDDKLVVEGTVESSSNINAGSGNDEIQIGEDLSGTVSLGEGSNYISVGDTVRNTITGGSGSDEIYIGGDVKGSINAGAGEDTLIVDGGVGQNTTITMGSGNDFVVISGTLGDNVYIKGEGGTDSIVLEAYTEDDYTNNVDNIQGALLTFENIMLGDGEVVKGDTTAFAAYSSGSGTSTDIGTSIFAYMLSVVIDNPDASVENPTVYLTGIPAEASLELDGTVLTANDDGSYSIDVGVNATSIENLVIKSSVELPNLDVSGSIESSAQEEIDTASRVMVSSFMVTDSANMEESDQEGEVESADLTSAEESDDKSDDIVLSDGNNSVFLSGSLSGAITAESGNSTVIIEGDVNRGASITLTGGNNLVILSLSVLGTVDAGEGDNDTIVLSDVNQDLSNISNFENIIAIGSDGSITVIQGNSDAYESYLLGLSSTGESSISDDALSTVETDPEVAESESDSTEVEAAEVVESEDESTEVEAAEPDAEAEDVLLGSSDDDVIFGEQGEETEDSSSIVEDSTSETDTEETLEASDLLVDTDENDEIQDYLNEEPTPDSNEESSSVAEEDESSSDASNSYSTTSSIDATESIENPINIDG